MKHPHRKIIKQWLEDTTQEIEILSGLEKTWNNHNIEFLLQDINGRFTFRIKPKKHTLFDIWHPNGTDGISEIKHLINKKPEEQDIEQQIVDWLDKNLNHVKKSYLFPENKPDEYEHLKKALKEGKKIQSLHESNGQWLDISSPEFCRHAECYRVADEYEHLSQSIRDGKKIEVDAYEDDTWLILS